MKVIHQQLSNVDFEEDTVGVNSYYGMMEDAGTDKEVGIGNVGETKTQG